MLNSDDVASAEQTYDVSQGAFRFSFDEQMRSLLIDFFDDAAGNAASGMLAVYIGVPGGLPWATVKAGTMFCRPISANAGSQYVSIVPVAGSTGLARVLLARGILPPGRW